VTLQNLIAVAGLFATVFSAVAAAFAVKQSRLQRTTLTKPQLIVAKINIPFVRNTDEIFSMLPKKDEELEYCFNVPIKNVGLGTALNLKYSWDFDYEKSIENSGFSHTDTHQMVSLNSSANIKEINNTVYVENHSINKSTYFSFFKERKYKLYTLRKAYTDIEYIIPITQDKTQTFLKLPEIIPILSVNNSQDLLLITEAMLNEIHSGTLKVEYEDISGYRFHIIFSCTIRLIKYSANVKHGVEAVYELNFQRIHDFSYGKKVLHKINSKFNFFKNRI